MSFFAQQSPEAQRAIALSYLSGAGVPQTQQNLNRTYAVLYGNDDLARTYTPGNMDAAPPNEPAASTTGTTVPTNASPPENVPTPTRSPVERASDGGSASPVASQTPTAPVPERRPAPQTPPPAVGDTALTVNERPPAPPAPPPAFDPSGVPPVRTADSDDVRIGRPVPPELAGQIAQTQFDAPVMVDPATPPSVQQMLQTELARASGGDINALLATPEIQQPPAPERTLTATTDDNLVSTSQSGLEMSREGARQLIAEFVRQAGPGGDAMDRVNNMLRLSTPALADSPFPLMELAQLGGLNYAQLVGEIMMGSPLTMMPSSIQ